MPEVAIERAVWSIPNASFGVESLTDQELAAAIAEGRLIETSAGGLNFIDGRGKNVPPLRLEGRGDPADPLKGTITIDGGPDRGDQTVTVAFGDGTQVQRKGGAPFVIEHAYEAPGTYEVSVINDTGQRGAAVVVVPGAAGADPEPAPVDPPAPPAPPPEPPTPPVVDPAPPTPPATEPPVVGEQGGEP